MTTDTTPGNQLRLAFLHIFRIEKARAANPGNEIYTNAVRRDLLSSLYPLLALAVLAALLLWLTGRIGAGFEVHWGRFSSAIGAFLAGWATWFALADRYESNDENRADEHARSGIFKLLMWPGILLSVVGAAWWP